MSQPTPGEVHVDGYGSPPSKKKRKKMRKAELKKLRSTPRVKWEDMVPLIKSEAQQLVYGVVLAPDWRDSDGDIAPPGEIEKAAHTFLRDSRRHDIQHSEEAANVHLAESYIAPQDFEIEGQPVTKGSWVIALKVEDKAIWRDIEDEKLTGFSIGGSAFRIPEA